MSYIADTRPRPAPNEVDELIDAMHHLDDADLDAFLDALAGSQRVDNLGWRVRERRLPSERFPQRNVCLHRRGLTPGQIGQQLGMSRDAVKQVLRRRRQKSGYAKPTYPPTHGYAGNRRK